MEVNIYKCVIASPDDTVLERDICDEVFKEINETLGQQLEFRIESKRWEKDVRPSFAEDGQAVINEQLLDNYQLFVGIMWNKFGTPTKRTLSGTEEEFNIAYKRYLAKGDVEIMLYFNEAPQMSSELDLDQVEKMRSYKAKVTELGSYSCSYNGPNEFRDKFRRNLNDYFVGLLHESTNNPEIKERSKELAVIALRESVTLILKSRLSDALCLFSNQPTVWVDPVISRTNKISKNADENYQKRIDLVEFVKNPISTFIKSPPQFGLTCLSHFLCQTAWGNSKFWLYLDASKLLRGFSTKFVEKEIKALGLAKREVDCIVLDTWNSQANGARKLLRKICHEYSSIPIVVMQTIDDSQFSKKEDKIKFDRNFNSLHLLALTRSHIRKVVAGYNDEKNIGEENKILNKVISDLEVLNVHRTPQNCLTLLKVAEKHFDESPVNRTKMIEMVLFVLFDLNELPAYTSLPDVKDCEYILGCFCEKLLRTHTYEFSREGFLEDLALYCSEKYLHIEVSVVFDVLYMNFIIIQKDSGFAFRSTYWIYYFAATRMYINDEFCEYIIEERPHTEIIEFYTGIDRNRGDLLIKLESDLSKTCSLVEEKTGLSDDLNPLRDALWNPSEEALRKMTEEVAEDVLTSNLPDSVKDKFADNKYNQVKPYDQSVQNILTEYSMTTLKHQIKSASRALRNSDYVDSEVKRKLLTQIMRGWKLWSQILFALGPFLAHEGKAAFDGQSFTLVGDFGDTYEDKLNSIIEFNSYNILIYFKDDLYSQKIGPLLYDASTSEENDLTQHHLMLFIAATRPAKWKKMLKSILNHYQTILSIFMK